MLFNSLDFFIFLPLVFAIYWLLPRKSLGSQNILLIAASYLFYGWWDWRFLILIVLSSIVDYTLARFIESNDNKFYRNSLLWTSIIVNLGILSVFKYFNFFVESTEQLLSIIGFKADFFTLNILLPVGISFYTFQTLSYTIDVYRKDIQAEKNVLAFFAYVSFFPQLVAGPIERAKNFLPQFHTEKKFDYSSVVDGCRQILWGFFKKVVIADSCALYVNSIFSTPSEFSSPLLILGAVLFAFQIYGDFSGYTDIALGTARLFGFNLMQNFAYPYFSRDIAEFWRRWHISLSSWFKDYLYFPLGGSRVGQSIMIRNTFIIFLVSGFWHGANWTFIAWGGLNAIYFLPKILNKTNRKNIRIVAEDRQLPTFSETLQMLSTFSLVCFAWIFFRANSVEDAINYIFLLFSSWDIFAFSYSIVDIELSITLMFIFCLLVVEWIQRKNPHGLTTLSKNMTLRYATYLCLTLLVIYFWKEEQEFIYFQF